MQDVSQVQRASNAAGQEKILLLTEHATPSVEPQIKSVKSHRVKPISDIKSTDVIYLPEQLSKQPVQEVLDFVPDINAIKPAHHSPVDTAEPIIHNTQTIINGSQPIEASIIDTDILSENTARVVLGQNPVEPSVLSQPVIEQNTSRVLAQPITADAPVQGTKTITKNTARLFNFFSRK